MNYHQPVYTLVTQKALIPQLHQRFGPYHAALVQCLELECISEGAYAKDAHTVMEAFDKEIVKAATKHAVEILDMLDIMSYMEYLTHRVLIIEWFSLSQKIGKKEYVIRNGQWYERTWEKVTVGKPRNKLATVYYQEGEPSQSGFSIMLNDAKSIKALKGADRMENRTKITISEQQKFVKALRQQVSDTEVCEKIRQRNMIVDSRNTTVRTPFVNEAVQEILGYSRNIFLCGPVHSNDHQYYVRVGWLEIVSFLKLVELMIRRGEDALRIYNVDTRNMRAYYDEARNQSVAKTIALMNNVLINMLAES